MPAWTAKMQWSSGCSRRWPPTLLSRRRRHSRQGLAAARRACTSCRGRVQSAATQWRGRPAGAATAGQLAALALENGLVNRAADQLGRQPAGSWRAHAAGRQALLSASRGVPFPTASVCAVNAAAVTSGCTNRAETAADRCRKGSCGSSGRIGRGTSRTFSRGEGLPRPLLETPPLACCRGRTCRRAARRLQHSCRSDARAPPPAAAGGHCGLVRDCSLPVQMFQDPHTLCSRACPPSASTRPIQLKRIGQAACLIARPPGCPS